MVSLHRIVALNMIVDSGKGSEGLIVTFSMVGAARVEAENKMGRNMKAKSKKVFTKI